MQAKEDLITSKDWSKVNINDGALIQSELLKSYGFKHGFFTKESKKYTPNVLSNFLNRDSTIHFTKQVHGCKVISATETSNSNIASADSIISNSSNQSLWIYTADCIPLLFADANTGHVAATHAGWKGLTANIIKETVLRLESLGCKPGSLVVALGPAISGDKYQVDLEVISLILKSIYAIGNGYILDIDGLSSLGIIKPDILPNKFYLDIRLLAKHQLLLSGLREQHISLNKNCTYSEANLFNSWRRDQIKSSQWSYILSKSKSE